jgi:hypothetical protein
MIRLATSALLCGLLLVVGVRSLFTTDRITVSRVRETSRDRRSDWPAWLSAAWGVMVEFNNGAARLEWLRCTQAAWSSFWILPRPTGINSGYRDDRYDSAYRSAAATAERFAGFELAHGASRRPGNAWNVWSVRVPFAPFALALLFGLLAIRHWRRIRLMRDGLHCRACGYDLRASANRCPECGTEHDHPTPLIAPASPTTAGQESAGRR